HDNATIPIDDRGFRYGDGIFDTLRIVNGGLWRASWHVDRLKRGLASIHLAYDTSQLPGLAQTLMEKNAVTDGLLRIQVTRGSGGRGYTPPEKPIARVVIETLPLPDPIDTPVTLWVSNIQKISPQ